MSQVSRKPLPEKPFTEDFKEGTEDIERVSTEIQEPPSVRVKNFKLLGWELSAHRPAPYPHSDKIIYASAKPTMAQRLDRILPPHRKYLGIRRKLFLIVLAIVLVLLLGLIIGLSVGLSNSSSK